MLEHLRRVRGRAKGGGRRTEESEASSKVPRTGKGTTVARRTGRTRLYAMRVVLHLENDLVAGVLKAKVQAAYPGEKRDGLHRAARVGVTTTSTF